MAKEEKLTIHKLLFDIQVDDKDAYQHFADRVSQLCKVDLPLKLDAILRRYDLPNGVLKISKLEVILGRVTPNNFENAVLNKVTEQFNLFLNRHVPQIQKELGQSKFRFSDGQRFKINTADFTFESTLIIPKTVLLDKAVRKGKAATFSLQDSMYAPSYMKPGDEVLLHEILDKALSTIEEPASTEEQTVSLDLVSEMANKEPIADQGKTLHLGASLEKEKKAQSVDHEGERVFQTSTDEQIKSSPSKEITKLPAVKEEAKPRKELSLLEQIQQLEQLPANIPRKAINELEKAFLYYIRYGRLPSNIKYELGMRMVDVFNINQKDIRFFTELKKHIARDEQAKTRLIRLTDNVNKESLVKKQIFQPKEIENFDPKIPRSFEDYFVALSLDMDISQFPEDIRRYSLNDMIRFFYADHPQKLKAIIIFILTHPSRKLSVKEGIEKLFEIIGKASIVKIIASFVRKAAHVNKALNRLNKIHERSVKDAQAVVLEALVTKRDPGLALVSAGFNIDVLVDLEMTLEIQPRIFLKPDPSYEQISYTKADLIDYYFTHGSLPFSSASQLPTIDKLSMVIQMLNDNQIKSLSFFKEKKYDNQLRYQSIGLLSTNAIQHIVRAISPNIADDLFTKFKYFETHIKSGVPTSFQKAFFLFYALKNSPTSYLEEMVAYWKKEFGDADRVIQKRWSVSEEIAPELNKVLRIQEESVEEQLKVDYEFQSYSQDISVKNAGLVILWPFLKIYFNMLDLLDPKGNFRSMTERARACHLLQFLAVKQSEGEELYYPLNKILTGYPLDEPLPYEIKMTEKEIDVSNALLKNVIKQWNALKGSSVDALRGSFLIRDGVLAPSPNGWLLTVEKKSYDILLDKLPWGIGMIKLSWAPYMLSVEWDRNIM